MTNDFGTLNWTILIVLLVGKLVLGLYMSKKVDTAEDFYLGKRDMPWWAIGIATIATYVSAMTFMGAPAWSYKEGLSVIAIHLNYPIVIVLVVTLFLPFFFNSGVVSIYDYQEKRFGVASRTVIAVVFLVTQILSSAAVLYGTSLVISFITGIDVIPSIIIVAIVGLVFTMMGGISAVIVMDVVQSGILLVGAGILMYILISKMPGSFADTLSQLKAQGKINPLKWTFDVSQTTTIWTGLIAMTIYHTTVFGANQMMVQRTLTAKNIGDAKKSLLMMGFTTFFIYFFFVVLGVLLHAYYSGKTFDNDNKIILNFGAESGMPGLLGIIAAAVLAASMSSLDAAFNSLSTSMTVDFYQKFIRPGKSPQHYLKSARWFTILCAALIILPAIAFSKNTGSILELLSKVGSFFVGAKLSMYLLGFYSKHTTEKGLLIGVFAGLLGVWIVAATTNISWPWYAMIGAGINMGVSLPASILLSGYQKEWSPYSIPGQRIKYETEGLPKKEKGWYLIPGKVDNASYYLLAFFVLTMVFLLAIQHWI
ncbi:MAG: sodium/solute symporter [Chitinophagaceae bacterium]